MNVDVLMAVLMYLCVAEILLVHSCVKVLMIVGVLVCEVVNVLMG
jgi:hypothetical protein